MRDKRPMEKFDIFSVDGHKLRVLAKIFETKSISRTAEAFDLNQSTISHTLDRLRAAIGDPLFVKAGRGIEPTEKAIAMMPRVLEIVGALEGRSHPNDTIRQRTKRHSSLPFRHQRCCPRRSPSICR